MSCSLQDTAPDEIEKDKPQEEVQKDKPTAVTENGAATAASPSLPDPPSGWKPVISDGSKRNFDLETGTTFRARVLVSRVDGSLKFEVPMHGFEGNYRTRGGMDQASLESLRKAVIQKRITLTISDVIPKGIRGYDGGYNGPQLNKSEVLQLHSFLKWLEPSECREFFCQFASSIEDVEMFIRDFGFNYLTGLWLFSAEDLDRPIISQKCSLYIFVPHRWFSSPSAVNFILNTKIRSVYIKYAQYEPGCTMFSIAVVAKLLESWLAGKQDFYSRCFVVSFPVELLKMYMERRFIVVEKGETPPKGGVSCESYWESYEAGIFSEPGSARYKIPRDDGAVMTFWYTREKDWTPVVIEMSCSYPKSENTTKDPPTPPASEKVEIVKTLSDLDEAKIAEFDKNVHMILVGSFTFLITGICSNPEHTKSNPQALDNLRKADPNRLILSRKRLAKVVLQLAAEKDELRRLDMFLTWLSATKGKKFHCQVMMSSEDVISFLKDFGLCYVIRHFPSSLLRGSIIQKMTAICLAVPLEGISAPEAQKFVLNSMIHVAISYYQLGRNVSPKHVEIIQKFLEPWMIGDFRPRNVCETVFNVRMLKMLMKKSFDMVKEEATVTLADGVTESYLDWCRGCLSSHFYNGIGARAHPM